MAKTWDVNKLVFLDESSIKTAMVRLYGRGIKVERVKDYIPDARWSSLNIVSSLRSDGSTEVLVYEGGMTGELFKFWVRECLVKTLRKGDIIILDNLSSHKVAGIKSLFTVQERQLNICLNIVQTLIR